MDHSEPVLTPEQREALKPQRPPERFAERVMSQVADIGARRRRRTRMLWAAASFAVAAAACVALGVGRAPAHGEILADARQDVRIGPHVIAVLERGARVAWTGDDVTQAEGDVFYRVEPGGSRRVHTPAGDVTVHGTCFDVKVRTEEGVDMKKRDAVAGTVGALVGAAVLVGVYEGRVTLSQARTSVDLVSGQAARADARGVHGPEDLAAAQQAFAASREDPWRAANASLADQVKAYQERLDENESQKLAIEKELKQLKAKVAAADRDAAVGRNPFDVDPRDLTQEDWKELAKSGTVRTQFFCPPPEPWHVSPERLTKLGLAPGDAPILERAVEATRDRMWQAVGAECTRMVGSAELAKRLGAEMCGMIITNTATTSDGDRATQLVADIRAGNKPMPPAGQIDPLTARLLALTGENASFESDLVRDFGPETAHRIARDEDSLGIGCGLEFRP